MCIFCTLPLNIVCKLALKGYYINKKQTEGKKKKVDRKNLLYFCILQKFWLLIYSQEGKQKFLNLIFVIQVKLSLITLINCGINSVVKSKQSCTFWWFSCYLLHADITLNLHVLVYKNQEREKYGTHLFEFEYQV